MHPLYTIEAPPGAILTPDTHKHVWDYQMKAWLQGRSYHIITNQTEQYDRGCTPDLSCCNPDLLAPLYERENFCKAYDNKDLLIELYMLHGFSRRALNVALADGEEICIYGEYVPPIEEYH